MVVLYRVYKNDLPYVDIHYDPYVCGLSCNCARTVRFKTDVRVRTI